MASPGARDEVIKLYKTFIVRSDSKSLIINMYKDFMLAFRGLQLCHVFITITNLSRYLGAAGP